MKIIKKGIVASDGIHITCPACGCEYVIKDRNDFDGHYMQYNYQCPKCHYADGFGVDPFLCHTNLDIIDQADCKHIYEVKCSEQ